MTWETSKTDWVSNDALTADDLNRIEGNQTVVKSHMDNADIHLTSLDIRSEDDVAIVLENRTSDPASPATGRIWIRTDL